MDAGQVVAYQQFGEAVASTLTDIVTNGGGRIKGKANKKTGLLTVANDVFNAVFDPIVGYFYDLLVLGKPAANLTLTWKFAATSINSVTSIIVATGLYMALRPALEKAGLLPKVK